MITWILIMVHYGGWAMVVEEYNFKSRCIDAKVAIMQEGNYYDWWQPMCIPGEK